MIFAVLFPAAAFLAATFAALYLHERRAHARAKADNARTSEANEGPRDRLAKLEQEHLAVLVMRVGGVSVYDLRARVKAGIDNNTGGGVVLSWRRK